METETIDVKPLDASSAAKTDVKKETFDSFAAKAVDAVLAGASSDEGKEKADQSGSKSEPDKEKEIASTDEKQEASTDSSDDNSDENEQKNEDEDKSEEEQTNEDEKNEQTEEEKVDTKTDDKSADGKTEKTIPYERFKQVNEKAQAYEQGAKYWDQHVNYCQQNQITPDQHRDGLQMLALINTNPEQALARLESLVTDLKVQTGRGLPKDLQDEVEAGTLSDVRAKELAQARLNRTKHESQTRQSALQQQQSEQQALLGALQVWSNNKSKLIPEFKPKTEGGKDGLFEDFIEKQSYLWTVETPRNITDAIALADKALAQVQERAKRYAPKPVVKKAPPTSGRSRHTENDKPASTDDILKKIGRKHGYAM